MLGPESSRYVPHFVYVMFWSACFMGVGGLAWAEGDYKRPGARLFCIYFLMLMLLGKIFE